jgi:GGDEF domain-containing protein
VVRETLELATRDVDLVSLARPGGDEFALTLCVAADADAYAIRDRLEGAVNDALANAGLQRAGRKQIGISVGIAEAADATTPRRRCRRRCRGSRAQAGRGSRPRPIVRNRRPVRIA